MRAIYPLVLMMAAVALADIGEKLRLGQNVKNVPQKNFNAGLQAPASGSIFRDNIAAATSHSDSNDEDNLDRLCNDPFHSFLCKSVGPRKNRINGQLRPGAQVPSNLFQSKLQPSKSGEAQLAAGIQPSFSFDSPSFTELDINRPGPSNQYLPSRFDPLPPQQDNLQFLVPVQQPQQNFFTYTPPSTLPPPPPPRPIIPNRQSSANQQPTSFRPLPTQPPKPPVQTFPPTTKSPQIIFPKVTTPPAPSNKYLPVEEQIDIRISASNLSPSLQGSAQLSTGIKRVNPIRPSLLQGEAQLAEGIRPTSPPRKTSIPLRQGESSLATENKPRKEERTHTLEELCNDAFHSFLCKPITKPRQRIDGRIRPGAKIPPHILQGVATSGTSAQKFPPKQQSGSAQLAEGIQNPNIPQGYYYPKPEIIPTFAFQATNQLPVQNFLIPNQRVTPDKVPERIPPPKFQSPFVSQATSQQSFQNFLIPNQRVTPEKVPERIPPPKFQSSFASQATSQQSFQNFLIPKQIITPKFQLNQNIFQTNQLPVQTFLTPKIPPPSTLKYEPQNLFSSNNQLSQNLFTTSNPYISTTPCIHTNFNFIPVTTPKPIIYQNPIAESAQISAQLSPFNNPNQLTQNGYQYSTPQAPFTYPTTTQAPFTYRTTTQAPFTFPTTTQAPFTYRTQAPFTYTTTTTQQPITSTNILYIPSFNELVTTTQRPTESTTIGYDYPKPSTPFTIPTRNYQIQTESQSAIPSNNQPTVITTPKPQLNNGNEGYFYQKPVQQFTLPTTTVRPTVEGYTYPKPANPFTLPARTQLTNVPQFNTVLTPVQVYNQQYQIPFNTLLSEDTNGDNALPPASQFLILKP